ncbi:MAG TPA: Gfo/Idh/MocA family oxidoreductase [Candidatus Lustribacter sp.]|nr:Gfo/Idh/MocA family oxidoreductase [Candidatus Lustribacter sp.]
MTSEEGPSVRWGILATGSIAATVASDLALVAGAERYAVASRDGARARDFALQHGFARSYGSHAALLADPDVDAVYIATPHGQHHAVASAVIEAGKPALVEKAFTCSAAAAADLVEKARAADVFLMEAMWLRFQPGHARVRALVAEGAIGEVRAIHADLGFNATAAGRAEGRLTDPAAGGGALLDCGVYVVSLAQWYLGHPSTVHAVGRIGPTGVDVEAGLLLGYPNDAHAILSCSFTTDTPGGATIVGTDGRIIIEPRLHNPRRIRLEREGLDTETIPDPRIGRGYAHEFTHVGECLEAGLTESPVMPLADTLSVMATLDAALDQIGAPHLDEGFTRP